MSPTLVFDRQGRLFAAVGSPGGSRIIAYVTRALLGLIDWHMTMEEAVSRPHVINRNYGTEIEEGTGAEALRQELEAIGHKVRVTPMSSGLQGFRIIDGVLDGAADPRREGTVLVVE